jgi:hypothetical protein
MIGNRDYRVYVTSETAALSRDLECADDDAAVEQARRLFPQGLVEIWQAHRLVQRIEATEAA